MAPSVEVTGLSKHFTLHAEPSKTLKERFLAGRKNTSEKFLALDDVSFEVAQGETVGLLGHNGSGKSTLLKCLAGTIRPSEGQVRVWGRVAAMLELGAGFHPDLTGRENVYLNASILGVPAERIDEVFDEIVDFSELHGFIDSQVKYYSSGMYARLGFAVAVHLEPDLLLVDEVLAVGDEAFQRKCLGRVRSLQEQGTTILIVTHSPDQVLQLCDRAIVLDHGTVIHDGDPPLGVRAFRNSLNPGSAGPIPDEDDVDEVGDDTSVDEPSDEPAKTLRIVGGTIDAPADERGFQPGETVTIRLRYRAEQPAEGVRARIRLTTHDGVQMLSAATSDIQGHDYPLLQGEGEIVFTIRDLPLMDARYSVALVLQDHLERFEFDRRDGAVAFDVFTGAPLIGRVRFDLAVDHQPG